MKISTVTAMALLSASCFAAPVHTTALDGLIARDAALAHRANAAPVAPPAPGVNAVAIRPDGWARIRLPKPTGLAHKFAAHERQAQT
ncbi:hypothetical protein [Trinickia mobilis]|uniref:hypothetical protein n=1 Tax=Trinickia mobilis TaxID=2816356 RepID=UPI001A8EA9FD|nr:hypothetical protein [Trinickia mobilis]